MKDERTECQVRVVDMIGIELANLRSKKEEAAAAEGERVSSGEAQKTELEASRTKAEAELVATLEAIEAQNAECAQAAAALQQAKEGLASAKES